MTIRVLAAILSIIIYTSPAFARTTLGSLVGDWVVSKNDVLPGDVQAYTRNDKRVIGHQLIIRKDKVYWIGHGNFNESCNTPHINYSSDSTFDISCLDNKKFGPDVSDPNFELRDDRILVIKWYDGLILFLRNRRGH